MNHSLKSGKSYLLLAIAFILLTCIKCKDSVSEKIVCTNLLCEFQQDPLGVDNVQPTLMWNIDGDNKRGVRQSAYQILVASNKDLLDKDIGDLWTSGKVSTSESLYHRYKGKPLTSRQQCFWKVRIWDEKGKPSEWSSTQQWTMGILSEKEWNGDWVQYHSTPETPGPAYYMRKEFSLNKKVNRAIARFACLGFVDLLINGKKFDETIMISTPYKNPDHRVKYVSHDVTDLMSEGINCVGAIIGNGYNSPPSEGWNNWQESKGLPRFLLEMEIEFTDGTRAYIGTDESWHTDLGRIQYNDFWVKEVHDLRKEQPGWDLAGFDAGGWQKVSLAEAPKGKLRAARTRPVRRHESFTALRQEGNIYFFDTIYTGFPSIKIRGQAGDTVSIRGFDVQTMRRVYGPVVIDYVLKDDKEVILEPRFFSHTIGPTIEIGGVSQLPDPQDVSIVRVYGDLLNTGKFESSNSLFNELHQIGLRTHLNYIHYYPNDPTREKAGWSQDMQSLWESANYLTDVALMYEEWWQDFAYTQRNDGNVASVAPTNIGFVDTWNDPWWGGMICFAPWRLYEFYGNKGILEEAYDSMKRYVGFLTTLADSTGGILYYSGASDWIEVGINWWGPPKRTPTFLVSTMAWIYYTTILENTAQILGKNEDAAEYRALAERIRKNFNEKYFDPESGFYANATDSQASLIMPLYFGVVPEGSEELVMKRLEENIHQRDYHLSTGFVSNPILLHGLTDMGRADLVGKIMNQKGYPSFYSVSKYGVFMETWNAGMAQMPSLGGSCVGWFYRALLGIRSRLDAPGFEQFIIKPEMMPEVTWAKGYYDSIRGRIISDWNLEGSTFTLHVKIPANTSAAIYIPAKDMASVTESGRTVKKSKGVKFMHMEEGNVVVEVGSGSYYFSSNIN